VRRVIDQQGTQEELSEFFTPECLVARKELFFLMGGTSKEYWWWEVFLLVRKWFLCTFIVLLIPFPALQTYAALWLLLLGFFAEEQFDPYIKPWKENLDIATFGGMLIMLLLGIALGTRSNSGSGDDESTLGVGGSTTSDIVNGLVIAVHYGLLVLMLLIMLFESDICRKYGGPCGRIFHRVLLTNVARKMSNYGRRSTVDLGEAGSLAGTTKAPIAVPNPEAASGGRPNPVAQSADLEPPSRAPPTLGPSEIGVHKSKVRENIKGLI